ncbi:MAG: enoyl-CoA hydratase/isomerase family protein [Planctomycetes bacterium]|nr:enoyl-CoA hydratase/isomerase family protein [Planctomycetota bacterium]
MAEGKPWETPGRGEEVRVPEDRKRRIAEALRGAYLGLVSEVLDSGITNVADLEMAVENALDMKAPFRLMNDLGPAASLALVEAYAKTHPGFPVGKCLRERAASGRPWTVPVVLRQDRGDVAVVVIRRPKLLNALDAVAFEQIAERMREIRAEGAIRAAVLTGFGVKAFVSGADVRFLSRIASAEDGERTCLESQAVLNLVQELGKPVVCALNGVAFGGGMELAMACTARIARRGMGILGGQPEPNLGIIPGAGGTQRLPRIVGIEKGAEILRTGRPVSAGEAERIGLVQELCEGDLLDAAVGIARALADGSRKAPGLPRAPLPSVPAALPPLDLGHLSRRIDAILCETILAGARGTLEEGLKLEARKFGECVGTEDMRIGIRNFMENGPGAKAAFVHR